MTPEQQKRACNEHYIPRKFRDIGWHFCPWLELDLVGPDLPNWSACGCSVKTRVTVETTQGVPRT